MAVELFEEHTAIIEAADRFLAALKRNPRPTIGEVSRLRVRLSSLIRQHRVTEEAFIFGPLMRDGGLGRMPGLESALQGLMTEKAKYSEHIRRWTPQVIEQDWDGYVRACEERISAVKRIVMEEETSVYQVVLSLPAAQMPRRA